MLSGDSHSCIVRQGEMQIFQTETKRNETWANSFVLRNETKSNLCKQILIYKTKRNIKTLARFNKIWPELLAKTKFETSLTGPKRNETKLGQTVSYYEMKQFEKLR